MSFASLFDFESELAGYTGAPYAVVTDGCTHALELVFRYYEIKNVAFSAYTYLSIPQLMVNLGIDYELLDQTWQGEYQFHGTNVWDSARRLEPDMFRPGQIQCLSFGNTKPLVLGKVGAILLDDGQAYQTLSQMRSDGRDLRIQPWDSQPRFTRGWHYCPTLESCRLGLELLPKVEPQCQTAFYPDCRKIHIADT